MNRAILILVMLSTILSSCASIRSQLIDNVIRHTALVQSETGICTGIIVDGPQALILTAEHCVDEGVMTINGMPAQVIKKDDNFALLKAPIIIGSAIEFSSGYPNKGDEVIAVGYGYGHMTIVTRHVANPKFQYADTPGAEDVLLDGALVPGMSGGPIVDLEGKLLALTQRNDPRTIVGFGCGIKEIKAFLKGT